MLPDRIYIHDPHAMVIFRVLDATGARVPEMDLLLTAGPAGDPNQLPQGFLTDRQGNRRAPGNLAFFLNHAVLAGCPELRDERGRLVRAELLPRPPYSLKLSPRVDDRLVGHWGGVLDPEFGDLLAALPPNRTTIIDFVLTRVVRESVFRLTRNLARRSFRDDDPGGAF